MTTISANQTFSFSRWRLLVARHWAENRRRYLLSLLAIGGLYAVWFSFLIATDVYAPMGNFMQFGAYMTGLFLVGCFFASMQFAELGSKRDALPWLSLPASHLEKLLCALLFGVVLFYLAFTLVFYCVDVIMVHWSNTITLNHPRYWPGTTSRILPVTIYNPMSAEGAPVPERENHFFTALYFISQAVFLLGSVYFARYSFIKTVVAVLLVTLAFVLFQKFLVFPLAPVGWQHDPLSWTHPAYDGGPPDKEVHLPVAYQRIVMLGFQLGFPPFFWFVTYIRLKEKEV